MSPAHSASILSLLQESDRMPPVTSGSLTVLLITERLRFGLLSSFKSVTFSLAIKRSRGSSYLPIVL